MFAGAGDRDGWPVLLPRDAALHDRAETRQDGVIAADATPVRLFVRADAEPFAFPGYAPVTDE